MGIEETLRDMIREEIAPLHAILISWSKPESGSKENRYFTRKQAAAYLSIALSTLDLWVRLGKLKKHSLGKSIRFDRSEIDEAIKSGGLSKYNGR